MKKLSIISAVALVMGLIANPAFSLQYCADVEPNGSKTFDEDYSVYGGCETFEIDIWICNVPEAATVGGFWIDFQGDADKLNITIQNDLSNTA